MFKPFVLDEALRSLDTVQLAKVSGRLVRMSGILLESLGCQQVTGQRCYVEQADGEMLDEHIAGVCKTLFEHLPQSH